MFCFPQKSFVTPLNSHWLSGIPKRLILSFLLSQAPGAAFQAKIDSLEP